MQSVYIIEDDPLMAECLSLAAQRAGAELEMECFTDAFSAMARLSQKLPDLILLDVILGGPDGFTFLNELMSYQDTCKVPIIIVTSLDLAGQDLRNYGVRAILRKETMTPADITAAVQLGLGEGHAE